jgi:hypothetical protein
MNLNIFRPWSILSMLFGVILLVNSAATLAKGVYQTPEKFIQTALGELPKPKAVWLSKEDKATIADILQHPFNRLRLRYWQKEQQTVWVLDEIGKEKPITIGVHINKNKIVNLKVLTFRETRGWEVVHEFFTDQFKQASLTEDGQLTADVDGITGATLSVRALTKTAKLSLWLNNKVQ